jgi:hypothetical protein
VGGTAIDGVANPQDVPLINTLQFVGPSGILRASHRAVDASISKHNFPHHKHTSEERITPGQILKLEIGIWAACIQFESGERLVLRVGGHDMRMPEFEHLRGKFPTGNKVRHVVHVGSEYDSHLGGAASGGIRTTMCWLHEPGIQISQLDLISTLDLHSYNP